ncbi:methyl-accepting chemotaxis protein [Chitinivorax sp. PXF-14]|uniref:methyl-accepting chemotaxis protein n=1 Tax=Chitinivorax sp. PXF-14 TaxID=3230488 RepID=UPI0034657CED
MLRTDSIRFRILVLVCVALLALAMLGVESAYKSRNLLLDGRKDALRMVVHSAETIVQGYQAQEKAGTLSGDEARKRAIETLRSVRYGAEGKDYLYVWSLDGKAVMHPIKPEFEGQDMRDKLKDGQGRLLVRDMLAAIETSGRAFVDTSFPRPGGTVPVPKIQYVVKIDGWNWMIGSGLYVDDVDTAFRQELMVLAGVLVVIVAFVGGIGMVIVTKVLRQVGGEPFEAIALMARAADGDLTVRVENAPAGSMLASFDNMAQSLRAMVAEIDRGAIQLDQTAGDIKRNADQVADAAQVQTDSASGMAAAIEELTVSINHIADNAQESASISTESVKRAELGTERVQQVTAEMQSVSDVVKDASARIRQLEAQAANIGAIANVIKDIASQTNLLALNAAIEAARAGEQGRGFAVVADEVRGLAERTSQATAEISVKLDAIKAETAGAAQVMDAALPQVQRGADLAVESAQALAEIRQGAATTLERIRDVAISTKEQSLASNSIAQTVEQIAQMVEQTSASVKRTAGSATQLHTLSGALQQLVGRFRH